MLEYTLRFVTTRGVLKAAYTEVSEMKEGIHPKYYKTTIRCACGNVIETGSTRENITVEICSKCHPFYTASRSWSTPAAVLISSTRSTASSNFRIGCVRPAPSAGRTCFLGVKRP